MNEEYLFKGEMIKQIYYNEDNSWGIYVFRTNTNLPKSKNNLDFYNITLICTSPNIISGVEYNIKAELIFNDKYGWQYKTKQITADIPKSFDSKLNYLCNFTTKNIAKNILLSYPNIIEDIIKNKDYKPDFNKIRGIGESRYETIKNKIVDTYIYQDLIVMLSPLNVTLKTILEIANKEDDIEVLKEKIKNNPYSLIGNGLTFPKVDRFAIELNQSLKKSKYRVVSGIEYILDKEANETGNSYIKRNVLTSRIKNLMPDNMDMYKNIIDFSYHCNGEDFLYIDDEYVGLSKFYKIEKRILEKLNNIKEQSNNFKINNFEEKIKMAETEMGFKFTEKQLDAVKSIVNDNILLITGKAGTGKSSVIKAILKVFQEDYSFAMATLSAKASRRITEVSGFENSKTIHRLLEYDGNKFTRDEENPLNCNILILDECSMNSAYIFNSILKAVQLNTKLILVGDIKQLPPIGFGNVFFDLIKSNLFKTIMFDEVFRQAKNSGIIIDANKIREGELPFDSYKQQIVNGNKKDMIYFFNSNSDFLQSNIVKLFVNSVIQGVDIKDINVVVPRKNNCKLSTKEINNKIQKFLIKDNVPFIQYGDTIFKLGSRIINKVNDYKKNIVNGEMGTVIDIYKDNNNDNNKNFVEIELDDNRKVKFLYTELSKIDLGYATTVHSFQGSSNKFIIIGIDNTHYTLLSSNLIYTAITRAEDKCIVLANANAFDKGVKNTKEIERKTFLKKILENKGE